MDLLIVSLPWLAVAAYLVVVVRVPKKLTAAEAREDDLPFVSIIVPARNEEDNIGPCVRSLVAQDYPSFEVIVVDDGSTDATRARVLEEADGSPVPLRVLNGSPPPKGWFGKPWACWQGYQAATGDVFLFTDADTVHGRGLLRRAVEGMTSEGAHLLTVIGRQVMVSFWEQVLQPQFFMLLAGRYPRTDVPRKPHRWRHAIANGQYLLLPREVYEAVGGHKAVAGEVAEDLRLAQRLVRGGWRVLIRSDDGLETRMYRSLGGLVEGWSKNVATAALQTTPPLLKAVILPLSLVVAMGLWVIPPVTLVGSLFLGGQGGLLAWAATVTGISLVIWALASWLMKGNPIMAVFYPLGTVMSGYIIFRSWGRGSRIEWKDRHYEMPRSVRWGGDR